jgi:hypothetical protein
LGGNKGHLSFIVEKATQWVNRMKNGHLPSHIAWMAYKHQLWPSLRYGLGTMTNDIKVADKLLNATDYKMLNILGGFPQRLHRITRTSYHIFGGLACSASQPSNLLVKSICFFSITTYPQI